MAGNMMGDYTQWSVLWVVVKKGKKRVVQIDHDNDFAGARDMYVKAVRAGKKQATLRCNNVSFPPPKKFRARTVTKVKKVKRNGRIRKVKEEVFVEPMAKLNLKGIWWCPYCCAMRRFEKVGGFWSDDQWVPEESVQCPLCEASHRLHAVRKYNPMARTIEFKINTRRSPSNGSRRQSGGRRSRRR